MKEFFYTGILLFTFTTGSVIVIAYQHRTSLRDTAIRLFYRGSQLLFFYYLYNIVKLAVFNFDTQPLYYQFINIGTLTIPNILAFRSFTIPITILITYAFFIAFSSLFLYLHRMSRRPATTIALIIAGLLVINYATPIPGIQSPVIAFLYAQGFVLLPIALWLVPFLIGFFLAQVGFEKQKKRILIVSGIAMCMYAASLYAQNQSLLPSNYQFPLTPYFIAFGLFAMAILLYVFEWLERVRAVWMKKVLAGIRLLGDNTLHLYIYHWIVIDLTIWFFPQHVMLIWLTVPLFFAAYFLYMKRNLAEYCFRQEGATQDSLIDAG